VDTFDHFTPIYGLDKGIQLRIQRPGFAMNDNIISHQETSINDEEYQLKALFRNGKLSAENSLTLVGFEALKYVFYLHIIIVARGFVKLHLRESRVFIFLYILSIATSLFAVEYVR